jgi:gas vesicle protein
MKDQGKIIIALLAGAAVGAAIGLLLAPSSGSQLREDIADYVDDVISSARNKAEATANNLREYGNTAKSKFRSAVDDLSEYKDGVVDNVKSKAHNAAEAGREAVNHVKSRVKSGADDLNDSVQDA